MSFIEAVSTRTWMSQRNIGAQPHLRVAMLNCSCHGCHWVILVCFAFTLPTNKAARVVCGTWVPGPGATSARMSSPLTLAWAKPSPFYHRLKSLLTQLCEYVKRKYVSPHWPDLRLHLSCPCPQGKFVFEVSSNLHFVRFWMWCSIMATNGQLSGSGTGFLHSRSLNNGSRECVEISFRSCT